MFNSRGGGHSTKKTMYVRPKINGPKFDPYSAVKKSLPLQCIFFLNLIPLQCNKKNSFLNAYLNKPNEWMGTEWLDDKKRKEKKKNQNQYKIICIMSYQRLQQSHPPPARSSFTIWNIRACKWNPTLTVQFPNNENTPFWGRYKVGHFA